MGAPAAQPDVPDDCQVPPGFVMAPLEAQLRAAREDLHRWKAVQGPRVDRKYGGISPVMYAAGLQVRQSIIQTLLQLQHGAHPSQ